MKKKLVIGLGQTGLSILTFLHQHQQPAIGFDTRSTLTNLDSLRQYGPCYLEYFPETLWPEIEEVIVSPGVNLDHPVLQQARTRQLPIIGDIELFYRQARAPIIAITGTNAKSTVTTLVTAMLQACGKTALMGGNIGIPALELLDHPQPDYYVLELSSFQLNLVQTFQATVGVILNISPDHLDRHHTMQAYQRAKERIYLHCPHPIINRAMQNLPKLKVASSFGLSTPTQAHAWGILEDHLALGTTKVLPKTALSPGLSGDHNLENALSALAILAPLNLPLTPQLQVLQTFKGLPHRCVLVKTIDQASWYNDSKGTNVGATLAAMQGIAAHIPGKIILLLGGVGKDQDFKPLREAINAHARSVLVYGQDRAKILADLQDLPCIAVNTPFPEMLAQAKQQTHPGDAVLFSPACASFDMFRDYIDRGEQFTAWVEGC